MRELARGKRARVVVMAALVVALAAGVTLGMTQRGDAPATTGCTEATLGGSRAGNAALAVDCDALLAARHTLAGDGALNWSAGTPLAEWDGVTVAGAPPRVVGLDLRARGLGGAIPPQLAKLVALTNLDLSDNTLTGAIPTQLGSLTALTNLALSVGNAFTGCIPGPLWAATTRDLVDLELKTCISGTIEEGGDGTINYGESFGAGTYKVPFTDFTEISTGENKAIVFTVPAGLHIKAQGAHSGGSCITGFCPPPGMMFEGKGDTGDDKGFTFCLDFETGAECGRGYPITRRAGDMTDKYGNPPGARASRAARAAKYDSMIDQIVASSHIEDVP